MNDSILITIRNMMGPGDDYSHFDDELIVHINTFLARLYQLGIGKSGFMITGPNEKWSDFLGEDDENLAGIITYVYLKTKLIFDSTTLSSSVIDAMDRQAKELEWCLNVTVDPRESSE